MGPPQLPLTFFQNRLLPSPGTRARLWVPYPRVGETPGPSLAPAPRRSRKSALVHAIRQTAAILGARCWRAGGTPATAAQRGTALARVPDTHRGRDADRHGQEARPLRPPGRDHDPDHVSPRLRVGELCALTWDQVDFGQGLLYVTRLKHGVPSVHPLGGEELRALRRVRREHPESRHLFQTERNAPMTPAGFRKTLARIGEASPLAFPVHPHMLRHACGFKLANDGQDTRALQHYLGHRNIQHTVRYTELAADRFKGFWQD